jgi:hypothetical protein
MNECIIIDSERVFRLIDNRQQQQQQQQHTG